MNDECRTKRTSVFVLHSSFIVHRSSFWLLWFPIPPRLHSGSMPPDEWDYRNRPLPRSAYCGPTTRSVTFWLIAINCAVYLIDRILWKYVGVAYVIPGVEVRLPPLTGFGHYSEYMVLVQL